uniref:Uncharacterized protein n=1 Tax=Ditylenchus dipsaci TaxID=166011 RepID=A0A915DPY7_9BILA
MDESVCDPVETTSVKIEEPQSSPEKKQLQQSVQPPANDEPTVEESHSEEIKPSIVEPVPDASTEPNVTPICENLSTISTKQPKTPPLPDEPGLTQDEEEAMPESAHEMLIKSEQIAYASQMDESPYDSIKAEPEAVEADIPVENEVLDDAQLQAHVESVKEETAPEEDSGEIDEKMEIKPEPNEQDANRDELKVEPKKLDDEGEIVSDQDDAVPESSSTHAEKKKENRKRKRSKSRTDENDEPRSKAANTPLEDDGQSPRNRKTALEQLRSMKFSKKDPFNDSREHRTYRFTRDISPIRNRPQDSDMDKNRRSNDRRGPAYKPPPRNFPNNNSESTNGENSLTEDQRRQRSTMFLLQNEQQLHQQHAQLPAILQKSAGVALKQRIENLLALPDDQVFNLPFPELKVLLIHAAELSQEQNRLLNGRKAQLIELDQMIKKEKDLIDRISQDLPPQYRPNLSDELVLPKFTSKGSPPAHGKYNAKNNGSAMANGSFQQVLPPKLPTDFSMPPPIFNELTTPLANAHIAYPSMPFQPNQPPPTIPPVGIPSDQPNSSGFPIPNMGMPPPMAPPAAVPPTAMFSQPPPIIPAAPTSSSTYSMATHTITNTSIPPPTSSFTSAPKIPPSSTPHSMHSSNFNPSQPPPNISTLNFTVPPPSTQPDQNQNKSQIEKSHSTSSLPSMTQFNVPPPHVNPSGHPTFSKPPPNTTKPAIDVSVPPPTIGLGAPMNTKPSVSTPSVDLSQPPPSIQHQKPPPGFNQTWWCCWWKQCEQRHSHSTRPSGPPRPLMSIDQPPPPGLMERIKAGSGGLGGLVPNQQAQNQQNKKAPAPSAINRNQPRPQQQHQQQKLRQARQAQFNNNNNRSRNQSPAMVSGANAIPVSSDAGFRKSPLVGFDSAPTTSIHSTVAESVISNAGSFSSISGPASESCITTGGSVLQVQVHQSTAHDDVDSQLQNISPVANE